MFIVSQRWENFPTYKKISVPKFTYWTRSFYPYLLNYLITTSNSSYSAVRHARCCVRREIANMGENVRTLMVLPSGLNSKIRNQQSPPLPFQLPSPCCELNIICGILRPSAALSTRYEQVGWKLTFSPSLILGASPE